MHSVGTTQSGVPRPNGTKHHTFKITMVLPREHKTPSHLPAHKSTELAAGEREPAPSDWPLWTQQTDGRDGHQDNSIVSLSDVLDYDYR